jgi:hypothetical protein
MHAQLIEKPIFFSFDVAADAEAELSRQANLLKSGISKYRKYTAKKL